MAKISQEERSFHKELLSQLITLSTAGFGFVAALAWNEAIQALVQEYIQTFFPNQSGAISKLIYAVVITLLAVFITYQLSKLATRWGVKK